MNILVRSVVVAIAAAAGAGCAPLEPPPNIECDEYGDTAYGFKVSCFFDADLDEMNASARLNDMAPESFDRGGWTESGWVPLLGYTRTANVEFPFVYEGGRRVVQVSTDTWEATFEWTSSGLEYDDDGPVVEIEVVACDFPSCRIEAIPPS